MEKKKMYHSKRFGFYFENTWSKDYEQYKYFHILPSIIITKMLWYSIELNWLNLHFGIHQRREGQFLSKRYEEVKI